MQRILVFVLAISWILSLVGCGQSTKPGSATNPTVSITDNTTPTVDIPNDTGNEAVDILRTAYTQLNDETIQIESVRKWSEEYVPNHVDLNDPTNDPDGTQIITEDRIRNIVFDAKTNEYIFTDYFVNDDGNKRGSTEYQLKQYCAYDGTDYPFMHVEYTWEDDEQQISNTAVGAGYRDIYAYNWDILISLESAFELSMSEDNATYILDSGVVSWPDISIHSDVCQLILYVDKSTCKISKIVADFGAYCESAEFTYLDEAKINELVPKDVLDCKPTNSYWYTAPSRDLIPDYTSVLDEYRNNESQWTK